MGFNEIWYWGILYNLLGELHFGLCRSNKLRTLHGSYSELFQLTIKKLRTVNVIVVRGIQNRLHSFLELVSGIITRVGPKVSSLTNF